MGNFLSYFDGILSEAKGFNYKVPSDPQAAMADFYMLAYLRTSMPTDDMIMHNPKLARMAEYKPMIDYASDVMAKTHRDTILQDVFKAMCAETPHFLDATYDLGVDLAQQILKSENNKFSEVDILSKLGIRGDWFVHHYSVYVDDVFASYNNNDRKMLSETKRANAVGDRLRKHDYGTYPDRVDEMRYVMSDFKIRPDEAVLAFSSLFESDDWEDMYGGESWASIASGWYRLYSADSTSKIFVALDHIYDLVHNTGSVFTKLENYKHTASDSYDWIEYTLDLKRDSRDLTDVLDYASGGIARLGRIVLRKEGVNTYKDQNRDVVSSDGVKGNFIQLIDFDEKFNQLVVKSSFGGHKRGVRGGLIAKDTKFTGNGDWKLWVDQTSRIEGGCEINTNMHISIIKNSSIKDTVVAVDGDAVRFEVENSTVSGVTAGVGSKGNPFNILLSDSNFSNVTVLSRVTIRGSKVDFGGGSLDRTTLSNCEISGGGAVTINAGIWNKNTLDVKSECRFRDVNVTRSSIKGNAPITLYDLDIHDSDIIVNEELTQHGIDIDNESGEFTELEF